jgi:beta-N-acetylhexosaminidase
MNKLISFCKVLCFCPIAAFSKSADSLDYKIGQMIMIGVGERTALSEQDPLVSALRKGRIGGVVLFEKNVDKANPKASMQKLTGALQQYSATPLIISIDEEGGKVHRLKEKYGFPAMPSATYLGELNQVDSTLWYNRRLVATLKELGINVNYAPDVDMAVNPQNAPIVKNARSFGNDAALITKHASACIDAHKEQHIGTALKHFPGHGSSTGDTHLGIVDVTDTWTEKELQPFEMLIGSGRVDAVMIGHMVNRNWDTAMLPATLSAPVVNMLRKRLGFKGLVISDDMQMQAISEHYGLEKAILLSVNAGLDMIMFANTLPDSSKYVTAEQVHEIIKRFVLRGDIPRSRIDDAFRHVSAYKAKLSGS